jgi:hypothetical protein
MSNLPTVCFWTFWVFLSGHSFGAAVFAQGLEIKQAIKSNFLGKEVVSTNEWLIQGDKFRLTASNATNTTQYLFTGTLFYICGKLNSQQLKQIEAKSVNPQILEGLKRGTCQEVPSNFMVRFFLSPITSIESVDLTDGLKLTLGLESFQVQKGTETSPGKIAGQVCDPLKRSYQIRKGRVEGEKSIVQGMIKAQENICVAPGVSWRGGLWREVMKAVLRQPGGAALLAPLRKDYGQVVGLPLKGQIDQVVSLGGKPEQKMQLTLNTTSLKSLEISPEIFRLPAGYYQFNPENVGTASGPAVAKVTPGQKPQDQKSFVDFLHSAVFCGLAQGVCVQ